MATAARLPRPARASTGSLGHWGGWLHKPSRAQLRAARNRRAAAVPQRAANPPRPPPSHTALTEGQRQRGGLLQQRGKAEVGAVGGGAHPAHHVGGGGLLLRAGPQGHRPCLGVVELQRRGGGGACPQSLAACSSRSEADRSWNTNWVRDLRTRPAGDTRPPPLGRTSALTAIAPMARQRSSAPTARCAIVQADTGPAPPPLLL